MLLVEFSANAAMISSDLIPQTLPRFFSKPWLVGMGGSFRHARRWMLYEVGQKPAVCRAEQQGGKALSPPPTKKKCFASQLDTCSVDFRAWTHTKKDKIIWIHEMDKKQKFIGRHPSSLLLSPETWEERRESVKRNHQSAEAMPRVSSLANPTLRRSPGQRVEKLMSPACRVPCPLACPSSRTGILSRPEREKISELIRKKPTLACACAILALPCPSPAACPMNP